MALSPPVISQRERKKLARQPTCAIFAGPEFVGGSIVFYVTGRGVDVERLAGAIGDVAEVADHRALVSFFDVGIWPCALLHGIHEVLQMIALAAFAFLFVDELLLHVVDFVATIVDEERACVAAELDVDSAVRLVGGRPTDALPNERAAVVV